MTSTNGNIFHVTGPLCGEFKGDTKANDVELWYFLYLRLNKRSNKQSGRRWFEAPSHSFWHHCNVTTIDYSNPRGTRTITRTGKTTTKPVSIFYEIYCLSSLETEQPDFQDMKESNTEVLVYRHHCIHSIASDNCNMGSQSNSILSLRFLKIYTACDIHLTSIIFWIICP